jgi:hypothetical protein
MLGGEQDLTWTDTATDATARMWRTFGGHIDQARSLDWMLVLRPMRWLGKVLASGLRRRGIRTVAPARSIPMHLAGPKFAPELFPELPPGVRSDDATARMVVESLDELTRDVRLRVDYDEEYLSQIFRQVDAVEGTFVRRLVRREDTAIGWYAYLCRPGHASRLLHLCGRDAEVEFVLADLVRDASDRGSAVLIGRFEPHLRGPLRRRAAVLGFARCPLIHTRDPELRALLATDSSLLTDLDGEWFAT